MQAIPETEWMCLQCSKDIDKERHRIEREKPNIEREECYRCERHLTEAEPLRWRKEPLTE